MFLSLIGRTNSTCIECLGLKCYSLASCHLGWAEKSLVVVPVLWGEGRRVAMNVIDLGVTWILQCIVGLCRQFPALQSILIQGELEGGCGILGVLQTAGEPGHHRDTLWRYLDIICRISVTDNLSPCRRRQWGEEVGVSRGRGGGEVPLQAVPSLRPPPA